MISHKSSALRKKYLPFAEMTSMCMYPFKSFSTFATDGGTIFSCVPENEGSYIMIFKIKSRKLFNVQLMLPINTTTNRTIRGCF